MATPILQHVVLDRDPLLPAGDRAAWVYADARSTLSAGAAPPAGAVEAWLVDTGPHRASILFRPPGGSVLVTFSWAVTDPEAAVRSGAADVEEVCREFLPAVAPELRHGGPALQSVLDGKLRGRSFTMPGGVTVSGLLPEVRPPIPVPSPDQLPTAVPPPRTVGAGASTDARDAVAEPARDDSGQDDGAVWYAAAEPARDDSAQDDPTEDDLDPDDAALDGAVRDDSAHDDPTADGPEWTPVPVPDPLPRSVPVEGVFGARPQPGYPGQPGGYPGQAGHSPQSGSSAEPDYSGQPWGDVGSVTAPAAASTWWRRRLLRWTGLGRSPLPGREPVTGAPAATAGGPASAGDATGCLPEPVTAAGSDVPRQLVAQMPAGVPTGEVIGLQVRIVGAGRDGPFSAAAPMPGFVVPAGGTAVTVVVHAESGLVADGPLLRSVVVPEHGDSDPVLFAFRAVARGLHKVDVKAYAGGSFLAELRAEVSVDDRARRIDAPAQRAPLGPLTGLPGEVTLQVQADAAGHYVFQILSDRTQFSPVTVSSLTGPPGPAVEQVLAALSRVARGADYTGRNAREWLRQSGINLWNQLVPAAVKEQFFQVRRSMSAFTVATGHDIVPWELLYPLRPGEDEGFLIEQVPVVRRVFDQARSARIGLGGARYVVPSESPADALAEVAAVAARLGGAAGPVVDELDELLDLIETGDLGMAHFACHNNYRADAGSSIRLRNGSFVPVMLSSATVGRSLARNSPLVFINACRSAGEVPQYTQMMGWAKQFMAAGAGAFVGTLWDIRSRSAAAFADGFYQRLADGRTLGEAAHETRLASAYDRGDPTWLAYSVYGDPAARARGETGATR